MDAEMTNESEMRLAEMASTGSMTSEDQRRLNVKFYEGAILNAEKSKAAARPIFDAVAKVRIIVIRRQEQHRGPARLG